jgi:hypothetical protein
MDNFSFTFISKVQVRLRCLHAKFHTPSSDGSISYLYKTENYTQS